MSLGGLGSPHSQMQHSARSRQGKMARTARATAPTTIPTVAPGESDIVVSVGVLVEVEAVRGRRAGVIGGRED